MILLLDIDGMLAADEVSGASRRERSENYSAAIFRERLLEHRHRLAALDQIFVVDDDRRHGANAEADQTAARAGARRRRNDPTPESPWPAAHPGRLREATSMSTSWSLGLRPSVKYASNKARFSSSCLPSMLGPMQQTMRIERVVDATALVHVECEAELRAARADAFAIGSICSGVEPYLCAMCSTMSSPSGAICGFSSNGWK